MNAARRATAYLVLTAFALVFIYPFVLSLATTLKPRDEVSVHPVLPWPLNPSSRAWENILIHSDFPLWTLNSVLVTVFATLLRLFLDSLAGYALARLNWRGRGSVFGIVLAILAVPPIVLTVPRFLVLKEMSLLNSYAGLVLPLARPGLITLAILSFQGTWNEFLLPLIVVRASPDHWTLPLGLSTLGRGGAGGQSFDYPVMLAGSMLTILPVAIIFIVLQRFFVRGVASGAVKG